jgi:hypothetical protein
LAVLRAGYLFSKVELDDVEMGKLEEIVRAFLEQLPARDEGSENGGGEKYKGERGVALEEEDEEFSDFQTAEAKEAREEKEAKN